MKMAKTTHASLAAIAILAFAAAFAAPTVRAQDDSAFADPAVAAASAAPVQTIAPLDVLKLLQAKNTGIALVDTQPIDGYAEGHIPGALNYPWVMQIKNFPIALPRNKTLIFYGSCPNDTSDIVKQLAQFGYFNVKIMDGGWYKWLALKYPTAGNSNPPADSDLSQLTGAPAGAAAKPVSHAK
jgi:rhodanese-related sulfurtransferase